MPVWFVQWLALCEVSSQFKDIYFCFLKNIYIYLFIYIGCVCVLST